MLLLRAALVAVGLALLAGCGDDGSSGDDCDSRSDCAAGEICVDGACVPDVGGPCERDTDCPGGEVCRAGRCEPMCTSDDQCPVDQECFGNTCVDRMPDAGRPDAGPRPDAGRPPMDAGRPDAGAGDAGAGDAGPGDAGATFSDDSDGDGITDFQEGRFDAGGPADTDFDGTPDYLDLDSDADGIPDSVEAGDDVLTTPPLDSDFDGTPDFRDIDSDDNGVLDLVEGAGDVDGDGRGDYADADNDDDGIFDTEEIGPDPRTPWDTDGDGTPDYSDVDSDGDTIADAFETTVDTDGDDTPDIRDTDTDADGYLDAEEAGDDDLSTDPVDTDGDSTPDFRDPDSDGDGLSDRLEREEGTDRADPDSDDDGVSDLIEVGAGTDPLDPLDSPRARGDFVFVVPFEADPEPASDTLGFATNLQRVDIYFLIDTTGSMGDEITALQTTLRGTIIPGIVAEIPEAWFGVAGFEDYPTGGYGVPGDVPFYQTQAVTDDATLAQAGVMALSLGDGADLPESHIPALWVLSTRGFVFGGPPAPTCDPGFRGFGCFRPDAVPVVILVTDNVAHGFAGVPGYTGIFPEPPTYAAAIGGLDALGARVIGINSAPNPSPTFTATHDMLIDMAERTGTVDEFGSARDFVFETSGDGSGLGDVIVEAIGSLSQILLDVSARAEDVVDPGEDVDAAATFVDHLLTRTEAAAGLDCTTGLMVEDRAGIDDDDFDDTFVDVMPGTPVCFDIFVRRNDSVMPTLVPQLFRARITVLGDGFTPLDSRIVFFLVPPRIPDPNE